MHFLDHDDSREPIKHSLDVARSEKRPRFNYNNFPSLCFFSLVSDMPDAHEKQNSKTRKSSSKFREILRATEI